MHPEGIGELVIEKATNVAVGHIDHDTTLDQAVMLVQTALSSHFGPTSDVGTDREPVI